MEGSRRGEAVKPDAAGEERSGQPSREEAADSQETRRARGSHDLSCSRPRPTLRHTTTPSSSSAPSPAHLFTSSSSFSSSPLRCRMRSSCDSIAGVMWALWSDRRPQRAAAAVNRRARCPPLLPALWCCCCTDGCWEAGCHPSSEGSVASTRACPGRPPAGPAACKGAAAAAAAAALQAAGGAGAGAGWSRRMRFHCTKSPVLVLPSPEQRRQSAPACRHTARCCLECAAAPGVWGVDLGLAVRRWACNFRGLAPMPGPPRWQACQAQMGNLRPWQPSSSLYDTFAASVARHGVTSAPAAVRPGPALSGSAPAAARAKVMAKRKQSEAAQPLNEPTAAGAAGDEPAAKRRRSPQSAPHAAAQAAALPVRRGTRRSGGGAAAAAAAAAAAGRAESDAGDAAEEEQAAAAAGGAAAAAAAGGAAAQQATQEQGNGQQGPEPASGAAAPAGASRVSSCLRFGRRAAARCIPTVCHPTVHFSVACATAVATSITPHPPTVSPARSAGGLGCLDPSSTSTARQCAGALQCSSSRTPAATSGGRQVPAGLRDRHWRLRVHSCMEHHMPAPAGVLIPSCSAALLFRSLSAAFDGALRQPGGGGAGARPSRDCSARPQGGLHGAGLRVCSRGQLQQPGFRHAAAPAGLRGTGCPCSCTESEPPRAPTRRTAVHAVPQGAAASGQLNFGVEQYPQERQRYGPDLHAYLLQLW